MPLTTHGVRPRLTVDALTAITQVRDYGDRARHNVENVIKMFGGPFEEIGLQVIAGRVSDANAKALAQLRADYRGIVIKGFDDVLCEATARWDIRTLAND